MLLLKDTDKPVVKKLLAAGCCARCVLRFCCVNVQSVYRQAYKDIVTQLYAFISDVDNNLSQGSAKPEHIEEPTSKKIKLEPTECELQPGSDTPVFPLDKEEIKIKKEGLDVCVACLGILQEFCEKTYAIKISEAVEAEHYQFDNMALSVSLPAQLSVREHSVWLHVKKEIRVTSLCFQVEDVISVKEVFKWIVQSLLSKQLGGIPTVIKSLFEVGVGFTHQETDQDCHFLATMCPDCFKPARNKQSVFTRMAVVKAMEKVSDEKFLKNYPCPPTRPSTRCVDQLIKCLHGSIFVAGRYNKFSRNLPQTPWVIDGERRMESSVEELIAAPLLSSFKADGLNFSSSGREDVDVRTLGKGRPFAIELLNPHCSKFNKAEIRQLQETINQSSDKIKVRDLQLVSRDAMMHMKEGEEGKSKSYTALIWTRKAIHKEDIAFLDEIKELTLNQKTPLRVLHRRPLAVRPRIIHSMSTRYMDSHHFHLELRTQAGTYIKEFVHSDFGRTKPSLSELLKTETDIIELDVESVDVDWPPAIAE